MFNHFLLHSVDVIHACSYADALILQLIYYACVHVEYACAYPCKGIDSSLCSHIAICNSTVIISSFSFLYFFFIPFDHIFLLFIFPIRLHIKKISTFLSFHLLIICLHVTNLFTTSNYLFAFQIKLFPDIELFVRDIYFLLFILYN